jgi:predicted phosphodiesterase
MPLSKGEIFLPHGVLLCIFNCRPFGRRILLDRCIFNRYIFDRCIFDRCISNRCLFDRYIFDRAAQERSECPMKVIFYNLLALILAIAWSGPGMALDWTQNSFPDGDWINDRAEFGFGDGDETTVLVPGQATYYFRYSFDAEALDGASTMTLEMNYDDAFVAYINGLEVARSENMPAGDPNHSTLALWEHEGGAFESFDLTWLAHDNPWEYVDEYVLNLSVEVHQVSAQDEDLTLAVRLLIDGLPKIHANSKALYWPEESPPAEIPTDPITYIYRPLINIPAIVERGGILPITCGAPPEANGWQARLLSEYTGFDLDLISGQYESPSHQWYLKARIPPDPPMGLYDLVVTASGNIRDTTAHSVKIIDQAKDDFYIVHLTDTHMPERGASTLGFLEDVIDEINIINPEFVLLTGDYVNRSYEDQMELGQIYLEKFEVPVYLTSGNHDIGDGMEPWWKYFGWPYLNTNDPEHWSEGPVTQDYSFDYGDIHFVAPMTWVNYVYFQYWLYGYHSMISSQLNWLHQDLSGLKGDPFIVMFYHYDFGWYDDAPQMPEFFNEYNVNLALWGHTHQAAQYQDGPTLSLNTAASYTSSGGFRLLKFRDGQLVEYPHLWNQNDITLNYLLPNDGSSSINTATIVNTHHEDFEYALVRFRVPSGMAYHVSGGEILQTIDAPGSTVYEVQTEVPANGQVTVSIAPQTGIDDAPQGTLPATAALFQNSPNPFNASTIISFNLTGEIPRQTSLVIYNIAGQKITTLADGLLMPGNHSFRWDGTDRLGHPVASGLYFCRLSAAGKTETVKMALVR